MNCKPNQRAIVTRAGLHNVALPYLGMVFTVRTVSCINPNAGAIWKCDPDNVHRADGRTFKRGDPITHVADCLLTPLPDDPDPVEQDTRGIEHA